jgi:hypothetical protein
MLDQNVVSAGLDISHPGAPGPIGWLIAPDHLRGIARPAVQRTVAIRVRGLAADTRTILHSTL